MAGIPAKQGREARWGTVGDLVKGGIHASHPFVRRVRMVSSCCRLVTMALCFGSFCYNRVPMLTARCLAHRPDFAQAVWARMQQRLRSGLCKRQVGSSALQSAPAGRVLQDVPDSRQALQALPGPSRPVGRNGTVRCLQSPQCAPPRAVLLDDGKGGLFWTQPDEKLEIRESWRRSSCHEI